MTFSVTPKQSPTGVFSPWDTGGHFAHFVEGPLGSGKTLLLISTLLELLQHVPSAHILVLCSNHARQTQLIETVRHRLSNGGSHVLSQAPSQPLAALPPQLLAFGQMPIYTYPGFVRNQLFNLWPLAETTLLAHQSSQAHYPAEMMPLLTGLEESEFLLRELLSQLKETVPTAFVDFPGKPHGLVKQLVRRMRLRAENRLSRKQMFARSQRLDEICLSEVTQLEQQFDQLSFQLRCLDPNKQLDIFHQWLQEKPSHFVSALAPIKHLLVDDVDESTPAQQAFIRYLTPQLHSLTLTADLEGGSRRGYLNAFPYDWPALKQLTPATENVRTETMVLARQDAIAQNATRLLHNWQFPEAKQALDPACVTVKTIAPTRVEMLDSVLTDLRTLLETGYTAGDIALVLPEATPLSRLPLENRLRLNHLPYQVLTGTIRPTETPLCMAVLNALQLVLYPQHHTRLSPLEFQSILVHGLQCHMLDRDGTAELVNAYQQSGFMISPHLEHQRKQTGQEILFTGELHRRFGLPDPEPLATTISPVLMARYHLLLQWLARMEETFLQVSDLNTPFNPSDEAALFDLSDVILSAFQTLITPFLQKNERGDDLQQLLQSYQRQRSIFEKLSHSSTPNFAAFNQHWLQQVKLGVVADTPKSPDQPKPDHILIATPQKLIDVEAHRPIQLWLDIGSREWCRTDNAPLYNAWVHSVLFEWEAPDPAFNPLSEATQQGLIRARAGHITRTLMLLASEKVWLYGSELDDLGQAHTGLLPAALQYDLPTSLPADGNLSFPVHYRRDQAPVLAYKKGSMAVTAVPGAGKTFMTTALILKLIEDGTPPQHILVLTYMDSAAKTLAKRVKQKSLQQRFGNSTFDNNLAPFQALPMPVISTIHGLALRILTENDHAHFLGLQADDIDIIDETKRQTILQNIAEQTLPPPDQWKGSVESWRHFLSTAISRVKAREVTPNELIAHAQNNPNRFIHYRIQEFLPAYTQYVQTLHQQGGLDFDDLILSAIHLLETQPEIARYYQQQYHVILEDEAQDSSKLLQKLIALIRGEAPNLVRTGDPNQAITTSFSLADPEIFREFIQEANTVVSMTSSARCAQEVMDLANHWLHESAKTVPELTHAFYPVDMVPVEIEATIPDSVEEETALNHPLQNPNLLLPITATCFDHQFEELQWLVDQIKTIRADHPKVSIAVLLRANWQVQLIAKQLQLAQIPALSYSEAMADTRVFDVLHTFLKTIIAPQSTNTLSTRNTTDSSWIQLYEALRNTPLYGCDEHTAEEEALIKTQLTANEAGFWYQRILFQTNEFHHGYHPMLLKLYYDWLDFQRFATNRDVVALLVRMSDQLFHSVSDRSNGMLCASMAKTYLDQLKHSASNPIVTDLTAETERELLFTQSPLELIVEYFNALKTVKKQAYRSFPLDEASMVVNGNPVVHVMSLHKAKGQEFGVVFLPFLTEDNLRHTASKVRLDEDQKFLVELDRFLTPESKQQTPAEWQAETKAKLATYQETVVSEEARLAYVGLTRAQQGLFLSTHRFAPVLNKPGDSNLTLKKPRPVKTALLWQVADAYLQSLTAACTPVNVEEVQNA